MNPFTALAASFLQDETVLQKQMETRVNKNKVNSIETRNERNGPVHTDGHWRFANNAGGNNGVESSYKNCPPIYTMHSRVMGKVGLEQSNNYGVGVAFCEEQEEERKVKE